MTVHDEIRDQPRVLARLLADGREPVAAIASAVRARPIDAVVIAARGTSDHAAIYAQYLFGAFQRLPVALAAPSLTSLYGIAPRMGRCLVLGISQSGASPDVVGVVAAARDQGAPTIAITNTPGSPLALTAEHVIDLRAGPELAVAATKTYTAELLAVAMLSVALGDDAERRSALDAAPGAVESALGSEAAARRGAALLADHTRCVVLGRGFEYATARELALKLKELAHLLADPYSAADFRHGPLALVEPGFPVLAIAPSGPPLDGMVELLGELRERHDARLVVISDAEPALRLGHVAARLPATVPDWLRPVASIVPGQLLAMHVARARGLDPDDPRHIRKVTLTR